MQSRYHQAALDLLSRVATLSPAGLARVEARERVLGFPLPAAIREWYAVEDAEAVFRLYAANDGAPVPLEALGDDLARAPGFGCDLLVLVYENQRVCTWAAPLDGSDDPPVLVQVDGRRWQLYAPRFAAFACSRIWDGLVFRDARLTAQDRSLTAADLTRLRQAFAEVQRTKGWPTQVQYRFERRDQRILIADDEVGHADWWLAADDEASLRDLAGDVRDLGTLARTLCPIERSGAGPGVSGERVLRELRGEGPPSARGPAEE